jgi:hypothetical protein
MSHTSLIYFLNCINRWLIHVFCLIEWHEFMSSSRPSSINIIYITYAEGVRSAGVAQNRLPRVPAETAVDRLLREL